MELTSKRASIKLKVKFLLKVIEDLFLILLPIKETDFALYKVIVHSKN